jgi:hypothetical protein
MDIVFLIVVVVGIAAIAVRAFKNQPASTTSTSGMGGAPTDQSSGTDTPTGVKADTATTVDADTTPRMQ